MDKRLKLTDKDVAKIRRLYSKPGWTLYNLADRFGVSVTHISRIVNNQARVKE